MWLAWAVSHVMRLSMFRRVWISRNHRDQTLRARDNNSGSFDGLISVCLTVARGRGAITLAGRETFTRDPMQPGPAIPRVYIVPGVTIFRHKKSVSVLMITKCDGLSSLCTAASLCLCNKMSSAQAARGISILSDCQSLEPDE